MNRYLYAEADPETLIDPDGHAVMTNNTLCSPYNDFCTQGSATKPTYNKRSASYTQKSVDITANGPRASVVNWSTGCSWCGDAQMTPWRTTQQQERDKEVEQQLFWKLHPGGGWRSLLIFFMYAFSAGSVAAGLDGLLGSEANALLPTAIDTSSGSVDASSSLWMEASGPARASDAEFGPSDVTMRDYFCMGSLEGPRAPRLDVSDTGRPPDLPYDENGIVPGQAGARNPEGVSLTQDPAGAGLRGKPWKPPSGTALPRGFSIVEQATEADPTHALLVNKWPVSVDQWLRTFAEGLPWTPGF